MKAQTIVITPLGTFESDVNDVSLTQEQVESLKEIYEHSYDWGFFVFLQGTKTIYFPAEIIKKSIIILDVKEN